MALNKDTNVHSVFYIDESRLDPLNPNSVDHANTDPADNSRGYSRNGAEITHSSSVFDQKTIDDRSKKHPNDISNPDAGI
jgi:hypothetical protein